MDSSSYEPVRSIHVVVRAVIGYLCELTHQQCDWLLNGSAVTSIALRLLQIVCVPSNQTPLLCLVSVHSASLSSTSQASSICSFHPDQRSWRIQIWHWPQAVFKKTPSGADSQHIKYLQSLSALPKSTHKGYIVEPALSSTYTRNIFKVRIWALQIEDPAKIDGNLEIASSSTDRTSQVSSPFLNHSVFPSITVLGMRSQSQSHRLANCGTCSLLLSAFIWMTLQIDVVWSSSRLTVWDDAGSWTFSQKCARLERCAITIYQPSGIITLSNQKQKLTGDDCINGRFSI